MARVVIHHRVDETGLAALRRPIDDLVLEEPQPCDVFALLDGPFDHYERRLDVQPSVSTPKRGRRGPDTDERPGTYDVTETIAYRLAVPVWRPLFALPVKWRFRRRSTRMAWWAPPNRFDARTARVISYMAVLAIISGYIGSLLSQTLAFAGNEFGADSSAQAFTAGLIRLGAPLAFVVVWIADRRGRRRLLLGSAFAACILAALTSLAPTLWAYATAQAVFRGLSTAMGLLIGIVAVEESPAGSRAFVVSVISLCGGLGSGMVVWALPLTDLSIGGWRWIYVLTLLGLIPLLMMWRHIPETHRFTTAQTQGERIVDRSQVRQRLALLGATAFLFAMFVAPASTLNTDYLKTVHDFSGSRVSLFKIVTSTPIGLGVLVAGRLADRHGRKFVGAFGVTAGAILTVLEYNSAGLPLWIFGVVGTVLGGAVVPTLGVYGPELFGTIRRGRSNGLISMIGVAGSVLGLFLASWLIDHGGYGRTFTILLVGPLIVAGLIIFLFPETAQRTLEDINPEDAVGPSTLAQQPSVGG